MPRSPRRFTYPFGRPSVAADSVLLSLRNGTLVVLLIRRGHDPFAGCWAFPGGFVEVGDGVHERGEPLGVAAYRELEEETGLAARGIALQQLGAFGHPERDSRGRVISIVYVDLVPEPTTRRGRAGSDADEISWHPVDEALAAPLAFDHGPILREAIAFVRARLRDSGIAARSIRAPFTRGELGRLYRIVDPALADRARFRRTWADLVRERVVERVADGQARFRFRAAVTRARRRAGDLY